MKDLVHRSGLSDDEWMQGALDEARSDPVGLWQMVRAGREGFGLSGVPLEDFVRRFIVQMIAGGAVPVVGDRAAPFGWMAVDQRAGEPRDFAEALVADWRRSGADPDVEGIWFAFPSAWKQEC